MANQPGEDFGEQRFPGRSVLGENVLSALFEERQTVGGWSKGAKAGNSVPKSLRRNKNPYMEEKERELVNISSRVVRIWIDVPVSEAFASVILLSDWRGQLQLGLTLDPLPFFNHLNMTESDFTYNIEKYVDGTQSTELHTVETWTPKSISENAGIWIMFVLSHLRSQISC